MFKDYIDNYPNFHKHPVNKALHFVGIPSIIMGMICLATSGFIISLAMIGFGSLCLLVGHRIEGNRPALLQSPLYVLAAPFWYFRMLKNLFKK